MSGAAVIVLLAAAVLGVLVPWGFMRMLVPALADSATRQNYRGQPVFMGLGVVWLVWSGAAIVGGVLFATIGSESVLAILTLAGPLALVGFALGIVDDAFGTGADRGFRGHLKAMFRGRLTTGGLKLIGMGTACLTVALFGSQFAPWGGFEGPLAIVANGGLALLAGAAIALTANFVNLTDLRPGRALKSYSVLAIIGCVLTAFVLAPPALSRTAGTQFVDLVALMAFALGPVVAVWRYDLGESGMLGDAGANPMGAVAGTLIVLSIPLWALVAYFTLMLALNLASERVSFSKVIEGNGILRALDGWGRNTEATDSSEDEKSSPHSTTHPE